MSFFIFMSADTTLVFTSNADNCFFAQLWKDAEPSLQKEPRASWGAANPSCSGVWGRVHCQENAGARLLAQDPWCQRLDAASLLRRQRKRAMCASVFGAWRSDSSYMFKCCCCRHHLRAVFNLQPRIIVRPVLLKLVTYCDLSSSSHCNESCYVFMLQSKI